MEVRFEPFQAVLSVGFWSGLAKVKLEQVRLSKEPLRVHGYWLSLSSVNEQPPKFFLDERAFSRPDTADQDKAHWEEGKVFFFETEELLKTADFKSVDYSVFFNIFVYSDLKRHLFKYYISFPIAGAIVSTVTCTVGASDQWRIDDPCTRANTSEYVVLGWPSRKLISTCPPELNIKSNRLAFTYIHPVHTANIEGWEKTSGQVKARLVDLAPLMDRKVLAKEAGDLNLKLMKWQLIPDLDLDKIHSKRCLLFGAGTLGCNVLRLLLGWGIKKITLVDCGLCSFSNPVRQSMIMFEDVGKSKAEVVALNALKIDPSCLVEGVNIQIPMPGHLTDDYIGNADKVKSLITEHDVLFLLTDSRESRWLPTVLGASLGKSVITIALGLDSYVCLRHRPSCYFCNDTLAPSNTLVGRTLDQQCTVTRPGLSMIAAGLGVEMLIAEVSPAGLCESTNMPQQIRGSLYNMTMDRLQGPASEYCTACSAAVTSACAHDYHRFIQQSIVDPETYLEALVGIDKLKAELEECSLQDIDF